MWFRHARLHVSVVVVGLCLLLAVGSSVFAQGGGTPIQIGQNATGSVTAEANSASFALTVNAGDTALIQVLAISAGYAPNFRVVNAAGVEILNVANPEGKATLIGNASFNDAGVYTIVVGGENGSTGQFVLSLQAGTPLPEPTTLTVDQPVSATVGNTTPVQLYRFNTTSLGAVSVMVQSQSPENGALVTLYDESAGKTIASSDASVVGVAYQLPAGEKVYRVEVRAGGAGDTAFTICMGACAGSLLAGNGTAAATPTPEIIVPPTQTPAAAAAAGCSATSSAGGSVNLRSGPGTNYAVMNTLPLGQVVPVLARWTGGAWFEVNINGTVLWVGGSVVSLSGDCTALPLVNAPANAPLAPTAAPTKAPQPPANTPEVQPTDRPLPNLTVTNIRLSVPGDGTLNIDITVINAGIGPVDHPYAVKTCLDTTTCDQIEGFAEGLKPGETMSYTDSLPLPAQSGNHTISVKVDSLNEVYESNESDNDAFSSFNS
ncbi:MAG: SH3 domain-containing protein [Chloroflexi bacterium]|nr:SH3 domain-containing protein [Chloroflexota bacterium]